MRKSSLLIRLVGLLVAISCWTASSFAGVLEIPLVPEFDQFGSQIETIQGYNDGTNTYLTFSIYDTGASVVTLSYSDRVMFGTDGVNSPIPIKVTGGAAADGINGGLLGDVSSPGTVLADGLHAVTITMHGLSPEMAFNLNQAASVPGVQMFVGAPGGSEALPTITGTPIHYPASAEQTTGLAAKINMTGYGLDMGQLFPEFGDLFKNMVIYMPDISFVPTGSTITQSVGVTTEVARIPLALFGESNHPNPGDMITVAPNPVVQGAVTLTNGSAEQLRTASNKTFLFDTGAQLSIISTEIAEQLGLDLDSSEWSIDVQGAAGQSVTVPGYTIKSLELPRDDDGDGQVDGTLLFTNVPIHVLDVGFGIDGILGMNLFNTAVEMLYDPYDSLGPSLRLTFDPTPDRQATGGEELAMTLLAGLDPVFAGALGMVGDTVYLPNFQLEASVPEPSTILILAVGAVGLLIVRLQRQRPVGWVERTSAMRQDA
ncbi:MAG: retropepsin-like aspartic protease [Thermoguttaceae bacterium]|jgi:hypothetical protein